MVLWSGDAGVVARLSGGPVAESGDRVAALRDVCAAAVAGLVEREHLRAELADLCDQLTWRIVLVVGGFTVGTASLVVAVLFRLLG